MNAGSTSSIAQFRARQQEAWRSGRRVTVEELIGDVQAGSLTDDELLELIYGEVCLREEHGEPVSVEEYVARFGKFQERLERLFEMHREFGGDSWERFQVSQVSLASTRDRFGDVDTSLERSTAHDRPAERIGRFAVERQLGEGGFAVVYLAHDRDLDRRVAIKVPRQDRFGGEEDIERFLREARLAASLDHPGIVPVYEVQRDAHGIYIVQKYIDGQDLTVYAATHDPSPHRITELMIQVTEAVGAAHAARLYHRDLKGANILVDVSGRPYVADFGLALQAEQQHLHRGETAGSIPYMAPEQVRGEAHLLDGRADIWALGVILYELLTGTQPFQSRSTSQVFAEIENSEPPPPHQVNARVPRELSRICLACIAKRAADRYQSTEELAEDLQHWLDEDVRKTASEDGRDAKAHGSTRVVPKGLRSFDADEADFFLDLLPGPRDRAGLPASLRFWKQRIESTTDDACRVGLLYGPSGCGKSSLVKAGLLPRLASHVIPVFVEATAADTEARLLSALRAALPDRSADANLPDLIATLRLRGAPGGRKVLLVLDQFEQWLHARAPDSSQELVRALRQCDGKHVQCLLLVRDDFWMSITRFMKAVDVQLIEDENSLAVNLFDLDHSRKVLTAFGRAYGKLPDETLSAEQAQFLEEAVAGLTDEGQVVCVQLALFAQMMQERPWTPAGLRKVGGTAGLGVTFLEETFSTPTAPPQHRVHEEGVRAVLRALLPDSGTAIKGRMRSREELMRVAEYGGRPSEFDTLLGILDRQVRLITPTEPDATRSRNVVSSGDARGHEDPTPEDIEHTGKSGDVDLEASDDSHSYVASVPSGATGSQASAETAPVFYQLTHDYLVPSLREWLTRKQKETRRGRAELRLADLAAAWNRQPENRHLPSLFEYAGIRHLTQKDHWNGSERRLMRRAATVWGTRLVLATVAATVLVMGVFFITVRVREQQNATRAADLVNGLLTADVQQVPELMEELESLRPWADPLLRAENRSAASLTREKLHTALALLPTDEQQTDYLVEHLLATDHPPEVPVIVQQLAPQAARVAQPMWQVMEDEDATGPRKLRAACFLAAVDANNAQWAEVRDAVADELVGVSTVYLQTWMEALQPARKHLAPAVLQAFQDHGRSPLEHSIAKDVLTDYAQDLPAVLVEAIQTTDEDDFAALFPLLEAHADEAIPLLEAFLQQQPQHEWPDVPARPDWEVPGNELKAFFDGPGGMITESFAVHPSLPLHELDSVVEALSACGYSLHRLRPYCPAGDDVLLAATWQRDGRESRWLIGSAEEIRDHDMQVLADGFAPYDVSFVDDVSSTDDPTWRYAAVWVAGTDPERRMLVGLPEAEAESAAEELVNQGFGAVIYAVESTERGEPLVAVVLEQGRSFESQTHASAGTFRFEDVHRHLLQLDLQVTGIRPWQWLFVSGGTRNHQSAVWHVSHAYKSKVVAGMRPEEHASDARRLLAQGYRPVTIDVAPSSNGELVTNSLWHRPVIPEAVREDLAQRQANAAVALLRMGAGEAVWPLLRHREYPEDFRQPDDPRLRTYLIHRLLARGLAAQILRDRFRVEPDVSVRRALLLAFGEDSREPGNGASREAFAAELYDVFRRHPDAGLHAATGWLLRRWGRDDEIERIEQELTENESELLARQAETPREWYVTSEGHTMVVIEPGDVMVGSHPASEPGRFTDELHHRKQITRRFAMADSEVTRAQYGRFQEMSSHAKIDLLSQPHLNTIVRTDDSPITALEWYEAAAYSNWLSEQEGIPESQWVYEPNAAGGFGPGMRIRPGYQDLVGYRLPSEAEWEYACRAGAATPYHYGYSLKLLDRYAWFEDNSEGHTWPVRRLKPNDLGLFDMHGNAWNWTHSWFGLWSPVKEDPADRDDVAELGARTLRGGSYYNPSQNARAAARTSGQLDDRYADHGFRPVRTLPPSFVEAQPVSFGLAIRNSPDRIGDRDRQTKDDFILDTP